MHSASCLREQKGRKQCDAIAELIEELNELWVNRGNIHPTLKLEALLGLPPPHTEASVIQNWQTLLYCAVVPPSAALISGRS